MLSQHWRDLSCFLPDSEQGKSQEPWHWLNYSCIDINMGGDRKNDQIVEKRNEVVGERGKWTWRLNNRKKMTEGREEETLTRIWVWGKRKIEKQQNTTQWNPVTWCKSRFSYHFEALKVSWWLYSAEPPPPPHSILLLMLKVAVAAEVAFSSNLIFSYWTQLLTLYSLREDEPLLKPWPLTFTFLFNLIRFPEV